MILHIFFIRQKDVLRISKKTRIESVYSLVSILYQLIQKLKTNFLIFYLQNYINSMTELRIMSRQPSIQNIQINSDSPKKGLNDYDVNRLFVGQSLPKFQLLDIKMHNSLSKREKCQFFISILDRWNRRVQQGSNYLTNRRTEFLMVQFIYSSLKRLCVMNQIQIDKQLSILSRWFHSQTRNNVMFSKSTMPKVKNQNEYYMVTQTFKTNPTIVVQQYRRHKLFLKSEKKQQLKNIEELNKNLFYKKSFNNNFLTQIQENKDKLFLRDQNLERDNEQSKKSKCLLLKRQQSKVLHEQLRKNIQKKQIQLLQWSFKVKKGRLMSESVKNYFDGKFNTSLRGTKSSQGTREEVSQKLKEGQKIRLHTSNEKRTISLNPIDNNKNVLIPEVCQINSFGLLVNPLQIKIKKKKSKKK